MKKSDLHHAHVGKGLHYTTVAALLISNLTVLTLAAFMSNTLLGGGMAGLELQGVVAASKPSSVLQVNPCLSGSGGTTSGSVDLTRKGCGSSGPTIPAAPSNLTATPVSATSTQIFLDWYDNSSNESGFKVERASGTPTTTMAWYHIWTTAANQHSYTDYGVMVGATYSYRVRAYNSAGNSDYSNIASATAPPIAPTIPIGPTGLTATASSTNEIDLSWYDKSYNEDGFYVERATGTATSTLRWLQIATAPANAIYYPDRTVMAGASYSYRIRAYNVTGGSEYSNIATATTPTADAVAPSVPQNVRLSQPVTCHSIHITWNAAVDNPGGVGVWGYNVYQDGMFWLRTYGSLTYGSDNFLTGSTHEFRISSFDHLMNESAQSAPLIVTTASNCPPAAPRNPVITDLQPTSLILHWDDYASNESSFSIERRDTPTGSYREIDKVDMNVTQYADSGLIPRQQYCYVLRALNEYGASEYSQEACALTDFTDL